MTNEMIYQPMLLLRADKGFRGTEIYFDKLLPVMLCRGDAVAMCEFIGFPRMAVVRYEIDVDTRRKVPGSDVVLDVVGVSVKADLEPGELSQLGRTDDKGLRYWTQPGVTGSIVFPNVKEEDQNEA